MILLPFLAAALVAILLTGKAMEKAPLPAGSPISARADRRWRKGLVITAVAVALLGNIPLAGMPGFGWLELAYPIVRSLPGKWPLGGFKSGGSWPAAMLITAVWPASFLPAYWIARQARSRAQMAGTTAAALLLVILTGLGLAIGIIALYLAW